MNSEILIMNTVNEIENIFKKIKERKSGTFVYDEIYEEFSKEITRQFPNCQKDIPIHINEGHMNQDVNVHFIINSIPVCITNNEHSMAPGIVLSIMHVLACKMGISINVVSDYKFEFTPLQNPNYQ